MSTLLAKRRAAAKKYAAALKIRTNLLQHQQQAHLELALCGHTVQAVLVKTEALACGQLVVLALVADDGLALQCGQDALPGARCGVRPVPSSKAISTNFMLSV